MKLHIVYRYVNSVPGSFRPRTKNGRRKADSTSLGKTAWSTLDQLAIEPTE
jgi:hypothetical protein